MRFTSPRRLIAIELAAVLACLIFSAGCGSQRAEGVVPAVNGFGAILSKDGTQFGDVVTVKPQGGFTELAWDDSDAILVGTQKSSYGYGGAPPVVVLGTQGKFEFPAAANGVAYDETAHTFYFASNHTLYAAKPDGTQTTLTTSLGNGTSLAVDSASGAVYIVDGNRIDRFAGGRLTPYSRPGTIAPIGEGLLGLPSIAFDEKQKALYLADTFADEIKRILPDGSAAVVAGHCQRLRQGLTSCEPGNIPGKGVRALFGAPSGIIFDERNDDFIVADSVNNVLWRVTRDGGATPAAGYGPSGEFDGNAWRAFFGLPSAMAYSAKLGVAYVSDAGRTATYTLAGPKPAPVASPTIRYPFSKIPVDTISTPAFDGSAAWFAVNGRLTRVTSLGVFSVLPIPGSVRQLAVDRAGNVWASYAAFGKTVGLARIDTSGTIVQFAIHSKDGLADISALTIGPDGNPWFGYSDVKPAIGTVVSNAVKLFSLPNPRPGVPRPGPIVAGPDGAVWFPYETREIWRISTDGARLPPIKVSFYPARMAVHRASGDVWFLDGESNSVYRLRGGDFSRFPFGCTGCGIEGQDLTVSPDDTAWVAMSDVVAGVSSSGKVKGYYLPIVHPGASGIVASSDHTIWIAGDSGQMFRFDPVQYQRSGIPFETDLVTPANPLR